MTRGIPILLYHRIGRLDGTFMDRYTVTPERFAAQMGTLRDGGWEVCELRSLLSDASPRGQRRRTRRVAITFDDGFAENREHAWPVLKRLGFPSSTFVVAGRVGGMNEWDGPGRSSYPLLTRSEICTAPASLSAIFPHSMTHADLTLYQRPELLRDDLRESRAQLEAVIDAKSDILAYPRGSWSFAVIAAAKELGYVAGCTCMEGRNTSRTNPFLLRRVEIHDRDVGWRLTLKLRFGRDLLRWPPRRPASLAIAARWLRFARTRPAAGR